MAPRDDSRWRVMRPARLRLRRWGAHVVLYDDRSGDTHLLEDPGGRVLERLLVASADGDELLALTAGAPGADGAEADDEDRSRHAVQLADVLQRLRRLGIIKPLRK